MSLKTRTWQRLQSAFVSFFLPYYSMKRSLYDQKEKRFLPDKSSIISCVYLFIIPCSFSWTSTLHPRNTWKKWRPVTRNQWNVGQRRSTYWWPLASLLSYKGLFCYLSFFFMKLSPDLECWFTEDHIGLRNTAQSKDHWLVPKDYFL